MSPRFDPLVVATCLFVASCVSGPRLWSAELFSPAVLGPVPDPVTILLSADKHHAAYLVPAGKKNQVFVDGKALGPSFDGVFLQNSFVASNNGSRFAYAVATDDPGNPCHTCGPQGKWHVVIDGRPGPDYDRVTDIAFSPDGSRVAYGAISHKRDPDQPQSWDEWVMVVNGRETSIPYDALSHRSPVFTADGRLVYIARRGDKAVVVVDGKEDPAYDKIRMPIPAISPDGRQIAYSAQNVDHDEVVVLNGKAGPGFESVSPSSLVFSSRGRLAYGARYYDQTWSVVVDGDIGAHYAQVDNIAFGPDGKHFAYNARKGDKWLLVLDGKEVLEGEEITQEFPAFSPDGRRVAQGLKKDGAWTAVLVPLDKPDEPRTTGGTYDGGTGLITFSPDGERIAFVAWHGKKRMAVVDGKSGPEFDAVTKPIFSPDGRRVAYEAARLYPDGSKKDRWFVVVDGEEKPEYDSLIRGTAAFSVDSKHVIYGVCQGDKRLAVVDGQLSPGYKTICSLFPTAENQFELLVVGDGLLRLVWKPEERG